MKVCSCSRLRVKLIQTNKKMFPSSVKTRIADKRPILGHRTSDNRILL